jgi:DNA replication licensing factor MCM2
VKLDRYDDESADEEDFDPMEQDARLVAEAQMRRRDREEGRMPAAFLDDDDLLESRMPVRRRRRDEFAGLDLDDDQVVTRLISNRSTWKH